MARELGAAVGRAGIELVYGGGRVGLMGVVADAALAVGGRVVGVVPRFLVEREVAHQGLDRLVVVETMHERKAHMAGAVDAFIVLPGGFGTWEELFEVVAWRALGLHDKPCGVLDPGGYYAGLRLLLDAADRDGFIGADQRRQLLFDGDPRSILERLAAAAPTGPNIRSAER